ncbi:MAG: nucleotidyl transferase AbiEii/AbiGii toxin family protein [Pseudonocardiaceae bacterium]
MTQGTPDDVRDVVNGRELVRLWDQMYPPKRVRSAWQPLIDAGRPPLDRRFVTVDPSTDAECTVEVFAGRLRSLVTLDIGPVLHPDDLAADKVLALWDRARPRDYFDVNALLKRYGPDRLL